jgi:hypothetical protein
MILDCKSLQEMVGSKDWVPSLIPPSKSNEFVGETYLANFTINMISNSMELT